MHDSVQSIPGKHHHSVRTPAHAAATATEEMSLFRAPFASRAKALYFTPDAALASAPANGNTALAGIYKGSDGSGSTSIGSLAGTGMVLTAFDSKTIFSGADQKMAAGDVVSAKYTKVGSGALIPAGVWHLEFTPDYSVAP